jgi:hypothetical protein
MTVVDFSDNSVAASDHSRLVAAYVLALAAASGSTDGLHPGFVVLDEEDVQTDDSETSSE